MNHLVSPFWRRLFTVVAGAGIIYAGVQWLPQSEWNRERNYLRLVNGQGELRALGAARLAELGGQKQLVRALSSEDGEVRNLASDALWAVWIRSEGDEVYQAMLAADAAAGNKHYDEALRILDAIIADHPKFAEAWNRRAIVYWQTRRYRRSIQDCQQAVALNPNHFGAWHGMALCQVQLGNLLGARWSLEAVLHINPHDEHARQFLRACDELLRLWQPQANHMMEQS